MPWSDQMVFHLRCCKCSQHLAASYSNGELRFAPGEWLERNAASPEDSWDAANAPDADTIPWDLNEHIRQHCPEPEEEDEVEGVHSLVIKKICPRSQAVKGPWGWMQDEDMTICELTIILN